MRGMAIVMGGLMAMGASDAFAGNCEGVDSVAARLQKAAEEFCQSNGNSFKACTSEKLKKGAETAAAVLKLWNDVAANSWAKLGPRAIDVGHKDTGTVVNPGKRVWVSSGPAKGEVTVKVRHKDGKAGLGVTVCTVGPDGKARYETSTSVEIRSEKSPKDLKVAAAGRYVAVMLDPAGGVGLKYAYELHLDGDALEIAAR